MNISKDGIKRMILSITMHKGFSTDGSNGGESRAREFVRQLAVFVEKMPDTLAVPDYLLPFLDGSLLKELLRGYDRPLNYLCSDCRYPKWFLTVEEYNEQYPRSKDLKVRPDGFADRSGACPMCGD